MRGSQELGHPLDKCKRLKKGRRAGGTHGWRSWLCCAGEWLHRAKATTIAKICFEMAARLVAPDFERGR